LSYAQIFDLAVGVLSGIPVLYLGTVSQFLSTIIVTLLRSVQGSELWEGKGWKLRRPWCIRPRISLGETKLRSPCWTILAENSEMTRGEAEILFSVHFFCCGLRARRAKFRGEGDY
jgi:hypothetical protein